MKQVNIHIWNLLAWWEIRPCAFLYDGWIDFLRTMIRYHGLLMYAKQNLVQCQIWAIMANFSINLEYLLFTCMSIISSIYLIVIRQMSLLGCLPWTHDSKGHYGVLKGHLLEENTIYLRIVYFVNVAYYTVIIHHRGFMSIKYTFALCSEKSQIFFVHIWYSYQVWCTAHACKIAFGSLPNLSNYGQLYLLWYLKEEWVDFIHI